MHLCSFIYYFKRIYALCSGNACVIKHISNTLISRNIDKINENKFGCKERKYIHDTTEKRIKNKIWKLKRKKYMWKNNIITFFHIFSVRYKTIDAIVITWGMCCAKKLNKISITTSIDIKKRKNLKRENFFIANI